MIRLRPGMARATGVVVAGIAIAALVGLSRVYLEVHFLSDVSGGWALGASAYSLCAAVALVVVQLRQNGGDPTRAALAEVATSTGSSAGPGWSASPPSSG